MRRLLQIGAAASLTAILAGVLAWRYGEMILPFAVTSAMPNPQDGRVADGVYTNAYFGLSYPLPKGFAEGLAGPDPSHSGYYVLASFVRQAEGAGAILIAAQDTFFEKAPRDLAEAASEMRDTMAQIEGMSIDREPAEITIGRRPAWHPAWRFDFNGVGLYRAMIIAEMRCHLVSITLTAPDPQGREALAQSLDRVSFAARRDPPVCIRDYASGDQLIRKVEPTDVAPSPMPIPARIIIGSDGAVRHVHMIRATDAQRKGIEQALRQWTFKPHAINGRAVESRPGSRCGAVAGKSDRLIEGDRAGCIEAVATG
jgi:hypothetical protein